MKYLFILFIILSTGIVNAQEKTPEPEPAEQLSITLYLSNTDKTLDEQWYAPDYVIEGYIKETTVLTVHNDEILLEAGEVWRLSAIGIPEFEKGQMLVHAEADREDIEVTVHYAMDAGFRFWGGDKFGFTHSYGGGPGCMWTVAVYKADYDENGAYITEVEPVYTYDVSVVESVVDPIFLGNEIEGSHAIMIAAPNENQHENCYWMEVYPSGRQFEAPTAAHVLFLNSELVHQRHSEQNK